MPFTQKLADASVVWKDHGVDHVVRIAERKTVARLTRSPGRWIPRRRILGAQIDCAKHVWFDSDGFRWGGDQLYFRGPGIAIIIESRCFQGTATLRGSAKGKDPVGWESIAISTDRWSQPIDSVAVENEDGGWAISPALFRD
jgi:hypothetical protein